MTEIWICRTCAVVCILAACVFSDELNDMIASVWMSMRQNALVQHETFEPVVASLSFGFGVQLFRLIDTKLLVLHRYRIDPKSIAKVRDYKQFDSSHHVLESLVAYLAPLAIFDWLFPRRSLPLLAPTISVIIFHIIVTLVVYDFLFFWVHMAMHRLPLLAPFHRRGILFSIRHVSLA